MYLLGIEIINGHFLKLYIYDNYNLPLDFILIVPAITNISNNSFRNLQKIEKQYIMFDFFYYMEKNIVIFEGFLTNYIESVNNLKIDFNNITDNKNNNFKYTLFNDYAEYFDYEEFPTFYEDIKDNIYEVREIETIGNNFTLILYENITLEREINIQLIEYENKSNVIESKCILSEENENKITCRVDLKENKNLLMKDYFYWNKENRELLSIYIDEPNENIIIIEPQTYTENKTSSNINPPSSSENRASSSNIRPSSSSIKSSSSENKSSNKSSSSKIKPSNSIIKPSSSENFGNVSKILISESSGNKLSSGIIAIIVIGSLILIIFIGLIILMIFKKKAKIEPDKVSEINKTVNINDTLNSKVNNV